jgi:rRNA processing protein Krr1/Pno1
VRRSAEIATHQPTHRSFTRRLFAKYTEAEIESKRQNDELNEGIRSLKGESVKVASERSLTPASAAVQISHIVVEIDRGIEFDTALKALTEANATAKEIKVRTCVGIKTRGGPEI